MLYIIHKNQKDSKGTILATACQRFDFQTIPGKPSSAFVSSALPTRPRRRASSCFHQRYRTTHHDAKVAAHTTLLITFVHNKYLTFNTCNTLQHCIILVCPFCPFCPLSLSFFLSFILSILQSESAASMNPMSASYAPSSCTMCTLFGFVWALV